MSGRCVKQPAAFPSFVGARAMFEQVRLRVAIACCMVVASACAVPALAASSQSNADALVQKFIDGPKNEADAVDSAHHLESLRLKELDALSEKLRKARNRHSGHAEKEPAKDTESASGLRGFSQWSERTEDKREPAFGRIKSQRVAVLLALRPGRRSSRRFEKTAEPIICFKARCFIGAGPSQGAVEMPRRKALGPSNALSARAGACRHMPRCVFRNIPVLPAQPWLQPVDLGWIRHDRRQPVAVAADPTCRIINQQLTCERTVSGPDYRLWLVPENVAREAGSELLQKALSRGLRNSRRQAVLDQSHAQVRSAK